MNAIHINLNSENKEVFAYKICGRKIISNQKISSLSAFSLATNNEKIAVGLRDFEFDNGVTIYKGTSWLAEKNRQIICSKVDRGFLVDVPEISAFFVSNDGLLIIQRSDSNTKTEVNNLKLEHILIGPALMLALALNQLFGLHASAVRLENKAILFTGESGFGKSTMARHLQQEPDFDRLSDDISVISELESDFVLNNDFPQLKLSDNNQKFNHPVINLGAVILLNRQSSDKDVSLIKLNSIDAVQALLNHAVAAQLFDKELVNLHLKFMANLATQIPVYKLNYPDGLEKIPQIAKILKRQFDLNT